MSLVSRHPIRPWAWAVTTLAVLSLSAMAQAAKPSVRDIVLDQIAPPSAVAAVPAAPVARGDAMAVSILVESPDGTLTPRSTNHLFRTGERLRVKMLASRTGRVSIINTNPAGVRKLVWTGDVKLGQETISPRMALTGLSGEDLLHVVLEPANVPTGGVVAWLETWLVGVKSGQRDVQLDVQNSPQATYLLTPAGKGLETTVRIVHHR